MRSKKPLIIGLVGLPGSGKTTIAQILAKKSFRNIILSSFIKEELKRKNLKVNRRNLQDIGDELRAKKGANILARLALRRIKKLKIKKAIIDGVRNLSEVKRFKKEGNFHLLGLSAVPDKRFQRLTKNIDKYNNIKTWSDFIHYELREDAGIKKQTGQQNKLCYLHADNFIDNNGGLKSLEKKLEKFLARINN